MYDCKAPLSRFYYPDTRRIINAFIIIIIITGKSVTSRGIVSHHEEQCNITENSVTSRRIVSHHGE